MKRLLFLWLAVFSLYYAQAQDTTLTLTARMFNSDQFINLSTMHGWVFKAGHNSNWASPALNTVGWTKRKPEDLSVKDADRNKRVEGWFRMKVRFDTTFEGIALGFNKSSWAAADLYVDGKLLASYGNTGANNKPYAEHYFYYKPALPVQVALDRDHLIAIHLVDYVSPYSAAHLKSESENANKRLLQVVGPEAMDDQNRLAKTYPITVTLWLTVSLILTLLFWLLTYQQLAEESTIRLLAIWGVFSSLANLCYFLEYFEPSYVVDTIMYPTATGLYLVTVAFLIIPSLNIVGYRLSTRLSGFIILVSALIAVAGIIFESIAAPIAFIVGLLVFFYYLFAAWKRLRGAQWAIIVGALFTFIIAVSYAVSELLQVSFNGMLLLSGVVLPLPLSFLVYVALRFREILTEVREKAAAVIQVTQEKNELLATQNERLEQQVEVRTAQLNHSLTELRATQTQLIQKEKLASLGELTAGIAHEIQNPLNFVNNFSEVSSELIQELKEEAQAGRTEDVLAIADDLISNLQKIQHHGGRASSIVRSMLEHSRTESGDRRPTDLNALADEYLKMAYHGLRAKDKTFNCELATDFDPTLERVEVAPQELGRVLLNLYNNAFYAVAQRARQSDDLAYRPVVEVRTQQQANQIIVLVCDNGTGMAESVKAKIFQPFFTTKPTGEGTGLGLSLSYDIITKGYGGTLEVESQQGQGTKFVITLPTPALPIYENPASSFTS